MENRQIVMVLSLDDRSSGLACTEITKFELFNFQNCFVLVQNDKQLQCRNPTSTKNHIKHEHEQIGEL